MITIIVFKIMALAWTNICYKQEAFATPLASCPLCHKQPQNHNFNYFLFKRDETCKLIVYYLILESVKEIDSKLEFI